MNNIEEIELDEWTISDVEIAMKKKYGKVDKAAIEKLKKVQHRGNVDRNDLVKVGHGKLQVESVEIDEAKEKKTWVVYNHDSGKLEKHFSNKISADRHMDKLNKKYEASGKLPYRVMQTEELELDEAKYEYDGKVVKISKKEFAKVHKDYKDTTKGMEKMLVLDPKLPGKALVSAPVIFEEETNESVQRVANAISFYEAANKLMSARQLKDPKKEMMVSLKGKVEVINKSDWAAYKKKGYIQAEQQEVDLNEAKPEYEVKYAKRKSGPIKVTKFMTLDQAKEFLAKVRKDGMNGIISKGGKPVKEEVELDEKTKWKMGDGRPRGGAYIENERFWDLPKDSLEYIIKDAGEAIKANPKARKATTGRGNWADQINDAASVLGWRKKNGIKEEAELDEDIATMGAFIFGGFALLPAMIAFQMIDAKMKGKLSGGIEKTVGNMISKFKKDKNYKPTSAEVAASKELEKEVKKENPSLFKKVMAKVTKIKPKVKEETELDEGEFNKLPVAAKTLAKYAVKHKKGPTPEDYDVFMWAAGMMKTGKVKDLAKYTMKQDTDVRDKIIDIVKDTLGKVATEKIFPVKIRGEEAELDEAKKQGLKLKCQECGKVFTKKIGPKTVEVQCPKCKGFDVDVAKEEVEIDEVVGTDESVERVAIAISFFEGRKRSPSARAKRDALRDIGRDKSKDDDDEVKSTKADRERADRNIINKLKKSADVKGNYEIKFDKGPSKKVPYKLVKFALVKNEKMKPADKLKFQKELERSYIDFLKALKGM